jgi:WD40 repeat protein
VLSASFSADSARIVTASWDKTARIWDAATGKEITVLRGHDDSVSSAAFSPDGMWIVTASWDKTARIWDAHLLKMSTRDLLQEACALGRHHKADPRGDATSRLSRQHTRH